jgi:predicted CXXCH cytochrome family protein
MKAKQKGFYLTLIIVILSVLLWGCMKEKSPQEQDQGLGENKAEKVYVGSDNCFGCHTEIKEQVAQNAHGNAFKPLKNYDLKIDDKVKVYEEVEDGEPQGYHLSQVNMVGVMSDHYVIGSLDDKYFRIAAVEREDGKWILKAASTSDVNNDGNDEWIIKEYTCGECHSPGLTKHPELEPGFSCETCHGPGSIHVTTRAKEAIDRGEDSCINCHTASEPKVEGDILIAQNHYGTRNWFAANHNKGNPEDCLTCHTSHQVNEEGQMIKNKSAQELCSSCHGDSQNAQEIMWVNPTDERNHFTKDHSFGKYPYEAYDDDPDTKPVEIRNPDTVKELKTKMGNENE